MGEEHFVIDNSVVMTWCFEDEASTYGDRVLGMLTGAQALVPAIWPLELVNVLLVAERRKWLSRSDTTRFLGIVRSLPIIVNGESVERVTADILGLARQTGLSSYDTSYLDLAIRTGLPLATLDKAMRGAARRCRVPLLST